MSFNGFAGESSADYPAPPQARVPGPDEVGLLFAHPDGEKMVIRPKSSFKVAKDDGTTAALARGIVNALVAGPTAEERADAVSEFLPGGTELENVVVEGDSVTIYLDFPGDFVYSGDYNEGFVHDLTEHFVESLLGTGLREFSFQARDSKSGEYKKMRDFLPQVDVKALKEAAKPQAEEGFDPANAPKEPKNLPTQGGFVTGALTGKGIVLNQSHGWLYDYRTDYERWRVQRTRTFELLEDYSSAMFMNHYVIPMLLNAGATVRPVREPDSQTNMVVIDNAMGSPKYVEAGSGWFNSGLRGYSHKDKFAGSTDNPFGSTQMTRLVAGVTGTATATATFNATIPVSGYYNVYISYAAGSDRSTNSHFQVHHSGGITDFRVDQTRYGMSWFLLGNFYFEANGTAKVVGLNDNGSTAYLNVDAVRFGGGNGSVARWGPEGAATANFPVSGRPRWQEEACDYLQYTGMLSSGIFYNSASALKGDESLGWTNRPRYAQWEQTRDSLGTNLIYIGWHTNASSWSCSSGVETSGGGRGTTTYQDLTGATANTTALTTAMHNALIKNIRTTTYLTNWQDRGIVKSDDYGECSQANLGSVAGFFFEGLFHDNSSDAECYRDPKWRYAAARGIAQGVISYYGGTVFPPEPVTNFRVKNIGSNQVQLNWTAGPVRTASLYYGSAATNFRVYKSSNGFGFDNGTDVGNTSGQFVTTLTPGTTTFYRVAAVNAAGISVPSCTLAVRVPTSGMPTVTLVNGYLRNDKFLGPLVASSGIGGCASTGSYRTFDPRKSNSQDYSVQHALAIAAKGGYGIDSCTRDAIKLGNVNLGSYPIVFWMGGQESEADTGDGVDDTSLLATERLALSNYLSGGGRLFISNAEMAWDLGGSTATTDEKNFMTNYMKASFGIDDANTYSASGSAGIFAGLGSVAFDSGTGSTYEVRFPDTLTAAGGATACMAYSTGGTAAVQYAGLFGSGSQPGKLVYMAFPFETITNATVRNNVMSRVIDFFIPADVENWKEF